MYLLDLRIQPSAWRLFITRKNDAKFAKFSEKVFRRDNYSCQFCGFQAKDYQEVINLDQNYLHNKLPNLVTACCFCTQCFFLNAVGVSYGGGTLIHMPEISQTELNSFCHVLFCSITNDTGYKDTAQSIYRNLKFRSQSVENLFGEGTSDPSVFAQLCLDTEISREESKKILAELRLLPSRARFRTQIEHWAVTALQELSSEA
jgi:intracellular multiplication protein IcmJ